MIHLLIKMIDIDNIKKKLTPDLKHTETRIYFGKIISSFIFNGQLSQSDFETIETKLKKSCKLKDIPYALFNEYCYDKYTYYSNSKMDRLISYDIVDTNHSTTDNMDCKINHIKLRDHNTMLFDGKRYYDHVQPFLEATLKLSNHLYIKLRKNIYTYDTNGPASSYQVYIVLKNNFETVKQKNDSINLGSKIIYDMLIL
jgi:hypothetical protein